MSCTAFCRVWSLVLVVCFAVAVVAQNPAPPASGATVNEIEALAAALASTKTAEERTALLGAKKELQTPALTQALLRQGGRLRTRPDFFPPEVVPRAITIFQLALRIAEQIEDKSSMALALLRLGDVHRNHRNQSVAIENYRKGLALYEALGGGTGRSYALHHIGLCYLEQESHALALEYFKRSLTFLETQSEWAATASVQSYIGDAYRKQQNFNSAFESYRRALTLFEALGDKASRSRTLNNLGLVYDAQGKESMAFEARQKSQTLDEELKQAGQTPMPDPAALLRLTDRLTSAQTEAEQKLLLDAEKGLVTRELLPRLFARINELAFQGNFSKALSLLNLAAKLAEQFSDQTAVAYALGLMGVIYSDQQNDRMARDYFQKLLALWEKIGVPAGVAQSLTWLGIHCSRQENYGLALWYFRKSMAVSETIENKELANPALQRMGLVYTSIGQFEQAEECLKQVVAQADAMGSKLSVAHGLHYLSDLHSKQGKFEFARQYAQKAFGLYEEMGGKRDVGHMWSDLAYLEYRQGNYTAAIEHYQKSITQLEALGDKLRQLTPLQGLMKTYYQQGDYQQVIKLADRAAATARPLERQHFSHYMRTLAGKAYYGLNQPAQAQAAFAEAILAIEDLRTQLQGGEQEGQHYFEDKLSAYHEMAGLLVAQGQPALALTYAERAKARTMLDLLRNGRIDVVKAMTSEEQAQEQRLKNDLFLANAGLLRAQQGPPANQSRLADLQARQQKARQALESFQAGLYAAHPELKIQRGEAPVLQSEEIAALLPDARTALLEFVVAEERAFLFAITKNEMSQTGGSELKVYPLTITAKELGARTEAFRQQLAKRSPDFGATARELYDLLLKPAAAQLQGKTALVIVPDGPLWELPFQALKTNTIRYLIEDHAISYVPSLTVLREMRKARSKTGPRPTTLLAFGNPVLGQETVMRAKTVLMDEKLEPLPEAEAQVKALARFYGPGRSKVYVGADAREERAKAEASQYRILHLATHGVLNDHSPMYSHLLLAQTGKSDKDVREANEDGLLEAWELMKLDLNADLVVLSACETARGRVGAGEGVIGLTWALFVAGCPRTVVSQWKVESASTTELMVEFHRQLRARMQNPQASLGVAQALRASALKMLRNQQYRHPFYWAGFVVVGDGF